MESPSTYANNPVMEDEIIDFFDLVLFGDPDEIRSRLEDDRSLATAADESSFTALHVLMTEDRPDIAQLLIKAGADVNARTDEQMTPLHLAQHAALVQILVRHGADINARAEGGQTPLHVAASEDADSVTPDVLQALLLAGADPKLTTEQGETAEAIASARQDTEKLAVLQSFKPR